MRYCLLFILALLSCQFSSAQQVPQFSLWSQNSYLVNPAVTGIKKVFDFKTGYRFQYAGIDGAPQTGYLSAHGEIKNRKAGYLAPYHGVGGKVQRDVFGGFTNFSVHATYAFHIPLSKDETLSFGTAVGAQQIGFDQTNASTIDPDIAIATNVSEFLFPNISFGAWYATSFFYVGANLDQLTRSKWTEIGYDGRFLLHGTLTGGIRYTNDKDITFLPKVMLRLGPNAPFNIEAQALFDFQNKFLLGLGYRNTDALIGIFKVNIQDNLKIAYSYDFNLSELRGGNFGGHELMIGFTAGKNKFVAQDDVPVFE
jgi:type IX secretion system PorP/SprF family membrane protein